MHHFPRTASCCSIQMLASPISPDEYLMILRSTLNWKSDLHTWNLLSIKAAMPHQLVTELLAFLDMQRPGRPEDSPAIPLVLGHDQKGNWENDSFRKLWQRKGWWCKREKKSPFLFITHLMSSPLTHHLSVSEVHLPQTTGNHSVLFRREKALSVGKSLDIPLPSCLP